MGAETVTPSITCTFCNFFSLRKLKPIGRHPNGRHWGYQAAEPPRTDDEEDHASDEEKSLTATIHSVTSRAVCDVSVTTLVGSFWPQ